MLTYSRSVDDGMLAMGHFEAVGDFETDNSEVHAAMTAARAFRDHSKAFVNLSICEHRLHRSMKEALRRFRELQTERRKNQVFTVLPPPLCNNERMSSQAAPAILSPVG